MKTEKELREIWTKYIDRPIYRVLPSTDLDNVLKNGINPKRDPYENMKPMFYKLFKIVINLEKKGNVMIFQLKKNGKKSVGSYWCNVALSDLKKPVVDFTPSRKSVKYYLGLQGGAMVACIRRFTKKIIEEKYKLKVEEWNLVRELDEWAEKRTVRNEVIAVRGSSFVFENALFQLTKLSKSRIRKKYLERYYKSPFGSYEHFKKVIKKEGLRKYYRRLEKDEYHLRVQFFIPAREIEKLK